MASGASFPFSPTIRRHLLHGGYGPFLDLRVIRHPRKPCTGIVLHLFYPLGPDAVEAISPIKLRIKFPAASFNAVQLLG